MLHLRGKALDKDRNDSGEEQRDEDEGLGPRSNVSLLDQHQHLKEKAEGAWNLHIFYCSPYIVVAVILHDRWLRSVWPVCAPTARKESAKEKQLKEEEKILESVAEGRGTKKKLLGLIKQRYYKDLKNC